MKWFLTRNHYMVVFACALALILAGLLGPGETFAAKPAKGEKAAKTASGAETWAKPNAAFDGTKISDMSKFDPAKWVNPEGEDTIRIAVVWPHSGPAAQVGDSAWLCMTWVAYDLNSRGGIMVDGKKKKIALFKADTMSKPDQAKKVCERMVLQEKVHVLMGSSGSNIVKIQNEVANKYKVISVNVASLSEELQDAENFNRYSFMTSDSTFSNGRASAYFYSQRKKEKKFYILCQDYSYGHDIAKGFKMGLKEYYPEAQLVGEDYHKLFLTDYAPYLTKIKASGAEVIFTGDWMPDISNLLKQSRQMGLNIPIVGNYLDDTNALIQLGIEGTRGLMNVKPGEKVGPTFTDPGITRLYQTWNAQWKNVWSSPFNTVLFKYPAGAWGNWIQNFYWTLSVVERAKSTDPEKIIKVWEGDTYKMVTGRLIKMRACDHKSIQGYRMGEHVPPAEQKQNMNIPPYHWMDNTSMVGPTWDIPAEKVLPWMDQKLDRCKGKNDWGE